MKRVTSVLGLVFLASCGADGAPFRPVASGGVTISNHGIDTSTVVGVTNGTVSAGVGF